MDFADAASIHAALSAMPAPKAVRGKPTVRMAAPAGEREDATTRTSQPRFSSVEGFKPGVKQAAPVTAERPLHVPTWMIPLVVLGGAAIMAVGAAIAYWWMR